MKDLQVLKALPTCRIVICGGRALKDAQGFKMLESLADTMGGKTCVYGQHRGRR